MDFDEEIPNPYGRRKLNPSIIRLLWAAIREGKGHGFKNYNKVLEILVSYGLERKSASKYIVEAIKDGILIRDEEISANRQMSVFLHIPNVDKVDQIGPRDEYCFECHLPYNLSACTKCFRVFHVDCQREHPDQQPEWPIDLSKVPTDILFFHLKDFHTDEDFEGVCSVCRLRALSPKRDSGVSPEEITQFLTAHFQYVKSWIPKNAFLTFDSQLTIPVPKTERELFEKMCLFDVISLDDIERKLKEGFYKNLTELHIDVVLIRHNLGIIYGEKTSEYGGSELLVLDCYYAIAEIRQCKYCFKHSIDPAEDWFCKPCYPAHELVFAKQRGWGYWPAKVIQSKNGELDVRFFGETHMRAVINVSDSRHIDTNIKQMHVRKTSGFRKAMTQLKKHQKIMAEKPMTVIPVTLNSSASSEGSCVDTSQIYSKKKENTDEKPSTSTAKQPTKAKFKTKNNVQDAVKNFKKLIDTGTSIEQIKEIALKQYESDYKKLSKDYESLKEYARLLRDKHLGR